MKQQAEVAGEFKFYTEGDENGAFDPPASIVPLCEQVEFMIDADQADERSMGIYEAIIEMLSVPVALLLSKAEQMLHSIIQSNTEDTKVMHPTEKKLSFKNPIQNLPVIVKNPEVPTLIDNDISDEELLAEYSQDIEKPEYFSD